MKNYFFTLILIVIASPIFAQTDTVKIQTATTDSIIYTCTMHPEIISNNPGKCPKCGMDLVQKNSSSSAHKMNMMMCPKHGMTDMNHQHDEKKKDNKKKMALKMGVMMVVMMTGMLIIRGAR